MSAVVTGEAVVLDLDAARVPSRGLAFALDALLQLALLLGLLYLGSRVADGLDGAAGAAAGILVAVAVLVGYPVTWETLTRGRSPGKAAFGLRVVRDDGGPAGFRQALVRALLAVFVDLWVTFGVVGVVVSLLSRRGKRTGDLLAGTFVVRDRVAQRGSPLAPMPPQLAAWAATLDLTGLPDELALAVRGFLGRAGELDPRARTARAHQLADAVVARVTPRPPAGTSAEAFLAAVAAERRRREQLRLAAPRPTAGSLAGGQASGPAYPAPSGSGTAAPAVPAVPARPAGPGPAYPAPPAPAAQPAPPAPSGDRGPFAPPT